LRVWRCSLSHTFKTI